MREQQELVDHQGSMEPGAVHSNEVGIPQGRPRDGRMWELLSTADAQL